jgi:hypothetical protein
MLSSIQQLMNYNVYNVHAQCLAAACWRKLSQHIKADLVHVLSQGMMQPTAVHAALLQVTTHLQQASLPELPAALPGQAGTCSAYASSLSLELQSAALAPAIK